MDNNIFKLDSIVDDIYNIDESYYHENFDDTNVIIAEATNGATKANVFYKLIHAIARFFRLIASGLKWLYNSIRKLFKRKNKSADQICNEVMGTSNKVNVDKSNINGNKVTVQIPSATESEVQMPPSVELAVDKLIMEFEEDGDSLHITYGNLFKSPTMNTKNYPKYAPRDQSVYFFIAFMDHNVIENVKNINDRIKKIFEVSASNNTDENIDDLIKVLDTLIEQTINAANNALHKRMIEPGTKLSLRQISQCQSVIDECNELFTKYDQIITTNMNAFNALLGNANFIRAMNTYSTAISEASFGINQITYSLSKVYYVNPDKMGSCNNPELLSQMVEKMMKHGIPSKYIMLNIYLLADESLKGNGSYHDPIWGQTRVVLFPQKEDLIYKIAYNSSGYRSNRNEEYITKFFSGSSLAKHLAGVMWASNNRYIIGAERVVTSGAKVSAAALKLDHVLDEMKNYIHSHGGHFEIVDVHSANIGVRKNDPDNNLVITDYGFSSATS